MLAANSDNPCFIPDPYDERGTLARACYPLTPHAHAMIHMLISTHKQYIEVFLIKKTNIFKRIYNRAISTQENAQHHQTTEKCKLGLKRWLRG